MASLESYHYPETVYVPGPTERIVAYVHDEGFNEYMSEEVRTKLYTSLNSALALCRSGYNDVVVVLPGHTENVASADQMSNLVAGTKIVGLGKGANRPTFTWTTATSTWLFDVANVSVCNCIFEMAGSSSGASLDVAAPITVSAAGVSFTNVFFHTALSATAYSSIGITTTAAADDLSFENCRFLGEGDGTGVTTALRLVGTDRLYMSNCDMQASTSSTTVGVMQMLTTAPTQVMVRDSVFINRRASSVHAATGVANATGVFLNCGFGILDNATLAGFETEGNLMFFNCQTVNLAGEAGAAKTPVSV